MDNKQIKVACRRVNEALFDLGRTYHSFIPVYEIDSVLVENGFDATEPAIYCGTDGGINEFVGNGKYISINWHKMESGRYEIVAYLN